LKKQINKIFKSLGDPCGSGFRHSLFYSPEKAHKKSSNNGSIPVAVFDKRLSIKITMYFYDLCFKKLLIDLKPKFAAPYGK